MAPACNGQTDGRTERQTDRHMTTAHAVLALRRAAKMDKSQHLSNDWTDRNLPR